MVLEKAKETLQDFIRAGSLFERKDHLLLAVSGGRDSMAMLYLLKHLEYSFSVAHCNFNLRGAESSEDAIFVRQICEKLEIPYYLKSFDTASYAERENITIQEAARNLRYRWFEKLRKSISANYILTGHQIDDSIETALINLFRGSGMRGLSGIPLAQGIIRRPMLCFSRDEMTSLLSANAFPFRDDNSNVSGKYLRNRFRNQFIPYLKKVNPKYLKGFQRSQSQLERENKFLQEIIGNILHDTVSMSGNNVIILNGILNHPYNDLLLYKILRPYGFTWNQINDICQNKPLSVGSLTLSESHVLLHDRTSMVLKKRKLEPVISIVLEEPGNYQTPFGNLVLSSATGDEISFSKNRLITFFDADLLIWPLHLRNWRAGDVLAPFGMQGKHQKIQDLLTNLKLSLFEKESVLVLESSEKICWVVGFRLDERFKISTKTENVIRAEWIPVNQEI